MSVLSYNGVTLGLINTHAIDDEPIYSDDGVEYLYTRKTISVTSVLAIVGGDVASSHEILTAALEKPRQALIFTVGNSVVVNLPAGVDANNGPFPRRVVIRNLNNQAFWVDFSIELAIFECLLSVGTPQYASHRWSESVTIDENFYTKKTRTGVVRVRSNMLVSPDALRGLVVTDIEPGFKRLSSDYNLQSDGLALSYTYVDEEQYRQAPAPATRAEGDFTLTTPDGAKQYAECRVKLEGPRYPGASKENLIRVAILIVMTKLKAANIAMSNGKFLAIGAIREALYKNEIEVRFRAMVGPMKKARMDKGPAGQAIPPVAFDPRTFDVVPPGSETGTLSMDPGTRGTANLGLVASALRDPCLQETTNQTTIFNSDNDPTDVSLSTDIPQPGNINAANVWVTASVVDDFNAQYNDQLAGFFTHYDIRSKYDQQQNIAMLGVASSNSLTSSAFAQLAAPSTKLITTYTAEKVGSKPEVPKINDSNLVLLADIPEPGTVEIAGDGETKTYRISGQLVYGLIDATKVDISFGVPPWVSLTDPSDATFVSTEKKVDMIEIDQSGNYP